VAVRKPDEGNGKLLSVGQAVSQEFLVLTVGLPDLTLDAVTVNGMLEAALGNADKDLREVRKATGRGR
jgi:hypothetical protein